jgi:hypothetical protein
MLALTVLALTACSGGESSRTRPPSLPKVTETPILDRLGGQAAKAREYLIHDAEQELIRACMARAGFQFVPTPSSTIAAIETWSRRTSTPSWEIPSSSVARRVGYGYLEERRAQPPDAEAANRKVLAGLSPAQQRRWNDALASSDASHQVTVSIPFGYTASIPSKGCVADAWRRLYGNDLRTWEIVSTIWSNLRGQAGQRTTADKRYTNAAGEWSKCMHDAGYELADPALTRGLVIDDYAHESVDTAHRQELALAKADAACAAVSGIRATGRRLYAAYSQALADQYQGQLLAYDEILDRATVVARETLRR